jgi:hypothetical protein
MGLAANLVTLPSRGITRKANKSDAQTEGTSGVFSSYARNSEAFGINGTNKPQATERDARKERSAAARRARGDHETGLLVTHASMDTLLGP